MRSKMYIPITVLYILTIINAIVIPYMPETTFWCFMGVETIIACYVMFNAISEDTEKSRPSRAEELVQNSIMEQLKRTQHELTRLDNEYKKIKNNCDHCCDMLDILESDVMDTSLEVGYRQKRIIDLAKKLRAKTINTLPTELEQAVIDEADEILRRRENEA